MPDTAAPPRHATPPPAPIRPAATRGRWAGPGSWFAAMALLVPLILAGALALQISLSAFRAVEENHLRGVARGLVAAMDTRIGIYIAGLQTLSLMPPFDHSVDEGTVFGRGPAVSTLLGGNVAVFGPGPEFRLVGGTLHDGSAEPGAPAGAIPPALRAALQAAAQTGAPSVSDLDDLGGQGGYSVFIVVPVERHGHRHGFLGLAVAPSVFLEQLLRQELPDGGFAAIADGEARVMAHTRDPEGERTGMRAPDWVPRVIFGQRSLLVTAPGWQGAANVYAVERLRAAPAWQVVAAQPLSVQAARAWGAVRGLLAAGLALALGFAAAAWWLRRQALHEARREAEALRAGRAEVRRLLSVLPAIVFHRAMAADGATQLLYRSGDKRSVLGWDAESLGDFDDWSGLLAPGSESVPDFTRRVLREGVASADLRVRQPDGGWRWVRVHGVTLTGDADAGGEVVGIITSIDAERMAEARAISSARLASVGEMAAGLAHELKQPLTVMSLAAENAVREVETGDGASVRRRLDRIVTQAARASDIIEHLRRFAQGPRAEAKVSPQRIEAILESALSLTRGALHLARAEVLLDIAPGLPRVLGERVALEQVFVNLIGNARDAMETLPPGRPRQLRVQARSDGEGWVEVLVADTGGGIAPDIFATLFEPFVTTKGPDKGTGLGLAICHGSLRAMGGSITAWNDPEGAVFRVRLRGEAGEAPAEGG